MKKTIGVFAHVDAGKTTFSEQILYHTGMIRALGRVDNQNAALDLHEIEKQRGITVFSDQAYFSYGQDDYYWIDTPGHADFASEMERAIGILDAAVVIVSGIDGIQSHTETVMELLKDAKVPVVFFINKMDTGHADRDAVLAELDQRFGQVVDFDQVDYEQLAGYSECLMEAYFEENFDEPLFLEEAARLFMAGLIHPVLSGSALKDQGIDRFLERLHQLTATVYDTEEVSGWVYKVKMEKGVRHAFVKLTGGTLRVRDFVGEDKVTEIKKVFGGKMESVPQITAGDLAAVTGISLKAGQGFGRCQSLQYAIAPIFRTKLAFDDSLSDKDVYLDMKVLEEEDPSLQVTYSSKKEITLGIMGVIQLEILKEVIPKRFGYAVSFEEPRIVYKETIADEVVGCGHFEPLRHYAEVILKIRPGKPGAGIRFFNEASPDHLTVGNQNLIRHHIFEKSHRGILTGSELTDLEITLVTGRAHNKHTEGGDFREATIRALRQGLEQAENVILEPIYEAEIRVPFTEAGKVLSDITIMHGTAEAKQAQDNAVITARVPVYTFRDYQLKLMSRTGGRARVKTKVVGYEPCHNPDVVIEAIGYDKVTDTEYPSSSIFCAKGKGYTVLWDEAQEYMHSLKK